MRKISRTRLAKDDRDAVSDTVFDNRPRGVSGATITSWQGSHDIDLMALFAGGSEGGSVSGAARTGETPKREEPKRETTFTNADVALSDGTEISFATPEDFTAVLSV